MDTENNKTLKESTCKRCEEIINNSEEYLELVKVSYLTFNRFINTLTAYQREMYTEFEKDLFKIQNYGECLLYTQGVKDGKDASKNHIDTAQNTEQNISNRKNDIPIINNKLTKEIMMAIIPSVYLSIIQVLVG